MTQRDTTWPDMTWHCVSVVFHEVKALTNASILVQAIGPSAAWLRTSSHPPEANDVGRQMCRIISAGHGPFLLDFLDLSYNGNIAQGSPYCVHWGESNFVCARQASERQTFEVRTSSNSQNTPLTLLFWSNNYTETKGARFWIEIRGNKPQR